MEKIMTEEKLKEIEERANRATPGEWRLHGNVVFMPAPDYDNEFIGLRGHIGPDGTDFFTPNGFTRGLIVRDAKFIAHAREDVLALVKEVKSLQVASGMDIVAEQFAILKQKLALAIEALDYYGMSHATGHTARVTLERIRGEVT
jgi:hypothetical protein